MTYFNDKKAFDRKWIAGDEEHDAALAESGISVEAASRIKARPIRWLVENIIPHDTVTVIAGTPSAGKTFFACQLAADAARVSQLRVVLATSGFEAQELLRWRLDQAEGDTRRIVLTTLTPNGFNDRRGGPTEEELDERLSILYYTLLGAGDPKSGVLPNEGIGFGVQGSGQGTGDRLEGTENAKSDEETFPPMPEIPRAAELLIIDDVDGWFGKPGNLMSAAALNRVIQRLNELARSLHVAIVVLARTQLSPEGRITSRQLSRLSQAASVVWMIAKDREQFTAPRGYPREQARSNDECRMTNDENGNPKSKIQNRRTTWKHPLPLIRRVFVVGFCR
jgi:hypothetical protein